MAMKGRKVNFEKLLGMIDTMVKLLGKEQSDEDKKRTYCKDEIDRSEDEQKTLEDSNSDLTKMITNEKGVLTAINGDVEKIMAGIKALDKAVAEATSQRKSQNS